MRNQEPKLDIRLRKAIRWRQYSYQTGKTYVGWYKGNVRFSTVRHPREMGAPFTRRLEQGGMEDILNAMRGKIASPLVTL